MTVAHALAEINRLTVEINTHNTARESVETVRANCSTGISAWQSDLYTLNSNDSLIDVKQADVFEGNMADSMSNRVADMISDISSGLSKASTLKSGLVTQITRLDTRISELEASRQSWFNTLRSLQSM